MIKVILVGAKQFPIFREVAYRLQAVDEGIDTEVKPTALFGSQVFIGDDGFLQKESTYDVVRLKANSPSSQFIEPPVFLYHPPSITEVTNWLFKSFEENDYVLQRGLFKYGITEKRLPHKIARFFRELFS